MSNRSRSRSRSPVRRRDSRSRSPAQPQATPSENPGTNLYIGNVSFRTRDVDLEDAFQKFGDIQHCEVVKDPYTKESRGFGFVTFVSRADAEDAVRSMDGETFQGRKLKVEVSKRGAGHTKTPGAYLGPPSASSKYGDRGGAVGRREQEYGGRNERDSHRGGGGGGGGYGGGGYGGGGGRSPPRGSGGRSPPRYDDYDRRSRGGGYR